MSELLHTTAIGTSPRRLDGVAKVHGTARYAFEQPVVNPAYLHPVQATIPLGTARSIHTHMAESIDGVDAGLTHLTAPRLSQTDDAELTVLQDFRIGFRGQFIATVIAETPEIAGYAASLVSVDYDVDEHDVSFIADHPGLYTPEQANGGFETDTSQGDVESALAASPL